ncbi:MAG: hypothetical protein QME75_02015, partial [Deltaproteobacteria bacterium]|nr:hypothetical protein [Deltaproteobacteria bacterium]
IPCSTASIYRPLFRRGLNLKVGKVTPKEDYYEVDIVTKDGSQVDKIQVNKQTGWFRSMY